MKILELMHSLEDAYNRFGDIDINVDVLDRKGCDYFLDIKELIIESEEFIIKCE